MAPLDIVQKNGYLGKGLVIRRASLPMMLVLEIGCRRMHLENGAGQGMPPDDLWTVGYGKLRFGGILSATKRSWKWEVTGRSDHRVDAG